MAKNLFSVPIFFIVFRETIEAAIIVSVLLSFVEQLMSSGALKSATSSQTQTSFDENGQPREVEEENVELNRSKRIIKRMRIQVWAGTAAGFGIALAIGAAFIAVFYTKVNDLWGNTEQIWEGVFSIIASILIYIMGLAFLKMDHSRVKWRIKLAQAFGDKVNAGLEGKIDEAEEEEMRKKARNGKWALFLLPFITVLREGLEAVVFVGGVSLGQPATSIPIAAIVGLIAGAIVGYLIYRTGSSFALHWFLVASTCVLFLIGAGLLSKGVGYFEYYRFAKKVGGDVSETGNGPGSYQVAGNVWHLTYGNPEPGAVGTNGGAQIANAIFGWTNNATIGTILAYVFFWLAVVAGLVYGKWSEGRVTFFGKGSKAYQRRMEKRQEAQTGSAQPLASPQLSEGQSSEGLGKTGSGSGDEIGVAPRLLKDNRMDSGLSEGEKDGAGYQKVAF